MIATDAVLLKNEESFSDRGKKVGRLQLILDLGRTGTSEVIKIIKSEWIHSHRLDKSHHYIIATTRKAATIINGCTAHSYKEGLGTPISNQHAILSQCSLDSIADRFKTLN